MKEFPNLHIPLGEWIDVFIKWLIQHFGTTFEAISQSILIILINIERFMLWLPWYVVIIGVGLIAWRVLKRWWSGVIMSLMLVLIGCFGYWEYTMITLALVITAVVISLLLGIPLGIIFSKSDIGDLLSRPVLDAMQTMPVFVYLIPVLILFGFGRVPAVIATIIYALPPIVRLTNLGIRQVPSGAVEAALSLGLNSWQMLLLIQLPLARPSIMVGINQTTMMALSMVVIGSMIGAKGLGMEVLLAISRIEIGRGFEAGISVVFLAIILDRIFNALAQGNNQNNKHQVKKEE